MLRWHTSPYSNTILLSILLKMFVFLFVRFHPHHVTIVHVFCLAVSSCVRPYSTQANVIGTCIPTLPGLRFISEFTETDVGDIVKCWGFVSVVINRTFVSERPVLHSKDSVNNHGNQAVSSI